MASSFGRMTGPTNLDQFVDTGKRVRGMSPSDLSLSTVGFAEGMKIVSICANGIATHWIWLLSI